MLSSWVLFKMGSQRVVLEEDVLRVVGWWLVWSVQRGAVQSVELSPGPFSLVIVLADGSRIRPFMFRTTGVGAVYLRAGLFLNAMSREAIAARITEWNAGYRPAPGAAAAPLRWRRIRFSFWLLLVLSTAVAAESIALTAANIW